MKRFRRWLVLTLCLVVTPATADMLPLTGGGTDRPMPSVGAGFAHLTLVGPDFTMQAGLSHIAGYIAIRPPTGSGGGAELIPGTLVRLQAGWSGSDLPGTFTYQGQTHTFNGLLFGPSGEVDFLSVPFVVPAFTGDPVVTVPFTLTLFTGSGPDFPQALAFQGPGVMTVTMRGPAPPGVVGLGAWWQGGDVQWLVQTPEPSTLLLVGTALTGLGAWTWRRRRMNTT